MNEGFPDFGLLRTFLRVVDERGFSRAARSLDVSQPNVSQQIKRLEDKLGHPLFLRNGKDVALNSDGEALVIFARSIDAVADKIRHYFSRPRGAGLLRIGMTGDFARTAMPSVLRLFSRGHENYQIEIEASPNSQHLFRTLDEGRLDLVVGKCVAGRTRGEFLWQEPLVWIGAATLEGPITDPVPLVVPPAPSETRDIAIGALDGAGRSWRVDFQSASLASRDAAIEAGLGVCAAIRGVLSAGMRDIGAAAGLPALPEISYFVDRRAADADPGVEAFATVLREAIHHVGGRRSGPAEVLAT